jgi:predicted nucleic acid-binding protein
MTTSSQPADIIDTSAIIERMWEHKPISEDVILISIIEHPKLAEYKRFSGNVLAPDLAEFELAKQIQKKLMERGRMKGAADLIIAATRINAGRSLLAGDRDYEDISMVSDLKVVKK